MMKLFLLGIEHECATRVPDKPLRSFAGTRLWDIYLEKLQTMIPGVPTERNLAFPFSGWGVALWSEDRRLMAEAVLRGVPIIPRDEASRNAHNDLATQFNFLKDIDCDWFLWPNGCAPFLKVNTILAIAQQFHDGEPAPITTVREKRGWIWDEHGRPLNEHAGSTQDTECYYESTYNVHVFSKRALFESGHYWHPRANWLEAPQMYVMQNEIETMDIDTMEDFEACEKVWRERHE